VTPEHRHIPDWAQQERLGDQVWIQAHVDVLWDAAQIATLTFGDEGRGAVVVDTTSQPPTGETLSFGYYSQERVEEEFQEDIQRLVAEYDLTQEFVVVLLKPENRTSGYRLRSPETEQPEWDWWYVRDREAALAVATEAEMQLLLEGAEQLEEEGVPEAAQQLRQDADWILQRLTSQKEPAEPKLTPPDIETLMQWEEQGGCEAACPHQRRHLGTELEHDLGQTLAAHNAPRVGQVRVGVKVGRNLVALVEHLGPLQPVQFKGAQPLGPGVITDDVATVDRTGDFEKNWPT
jgi:hypothetical protein